VTDKINYSDYIKRLEKYLELSLYDSLITLFSGYTYPFVFVFIFVLSIIPILTPPTWIVVVSAYSLNDHLNPFLLSAIGATAAVTGRLILLKASTIGRKAINEHRKSSLEKLRKYLEKTRYGYLFGTLLFAMTPLPSSMLFISYGLINAKSLGIVTGFWIGRFIVYIIMIYLSQYFIDYFKNILNSDIKSIIIIDIIGIIMTIFMLLIDWNILISERKLVFIKPKRFYS
jgi:membrane protein YqaA with SNARE-associated domain